jgi:hypothetical protein
LNHLSENKENLFKFSFVTKVDFKSTYSLSLDVDRLRTELANSEIINANATLFTHSLTSDVTRWTVTEPGFELLLGDICGNISKETFSLI